MAKQAKSKKAAQPSNASEVEALWATVWAAPLDTTAKLVLADYLEENGDPDTGYALRWCVSHDRWPRLTRTLAIWYTDPSQPHTGKPEEVERALLPLPLFVVGFRCQQCDQLAQISSGVAYRTLPDSIGFLGDALAELRRLASMKANA